MKNNKIITLAIETSCDETSVALLSDGREVLSNIIASQIDIHKVFGGVVPEIASRHHLENINTIAKQALDAASLDFEDIDFIAVTHGPGLVGALLIGLATAKAYSLALNKPLVGVNHIAGHIAANYIARKDLKPPFVSLIISGGHTTLAYVEDYVSFKILGQTRDDAAGEAFDKVARVMGLGYPGGPLIDKLARQGDEFSIPFKRVMLEQGSLDFSFSGTKTGVLNYINSEKQAGRDINKANIAASFQRSIIDVIVSKSIAAAKMYGSDKLVLAGGVASYSRLRELLQEACQENNLELYYPDPILCTDNAAMIGCAGYYKYLDGGIDSLDLDAVPGLKL